MTSRYLPGRGNSFVPRGRAPVVATHSRRRQERVEDRHRPSTASTSSEIAAPMLITNAPMRIKNAPMLITNALMRIKNAPVSPTLPTVSFRPIEVTDGIAGHSSRR
ncbi:MULTISPECIES: hypothetical protein [unclassified Dietzia]|uniref:hypothetical protein n=1 Tax=unclassified Dietzia TaxID=2617939 RepID=UPI0012E76D2B|nr:MULTISPECIES: hypothetical protein [unclassified Dietzia]